MATQEFTPFVPRNKTFKNLAGKRFGRLVALDPLRRKGWHIAFWRCVCDCGNERIVSINALNTGNTQSCGCYHREQTSEIFGRHWKSHTRIHDTWSRMISRCANPANNDFHRYGARGISVCERWLTFENFYADMGDPPPGTSIDRIDNNGNYEPSNCRWATRSQQNNNKRNVLVFMYRGQQLTITEIALICGIPAKSIRSRIKRGWGIERAANEPLHATHQVAGNV